MWIGVMCLLKYVYIIILLYYSKAMLFLTLDSSIYLQNARIHKFKDVKALPKVILSGLLPSCLESIDGIISSSRDSCKKKFQ